MMGKKKMSEPQANKYVAQHFRKMKDNLMSGMIEVFKDRVRDYKDILQSEGEEDEGKSRKRSPMMNKPAEEYERLVKFVETNIPGLGKSEAPPPPKKPGIPTAKEIRTMVERVWEKEGDAPEAYTKQQVMDDLRHELAYSTAMKTDKTKARTRKKAPKIPPANYTKELMQKNIKKYLKKGPDGVDDAVADMTARIRQAIKAGQDISRDDAIDALVYGLKSMVGMIKSLSAHPSYTTGKHKFRGDAPPFPGSTKPGEKPFWQKTPPPREFKGTPDFPIDSKKEADAFLTKIEKFIDEVNWYIAPDWVGKKPGEKLRPGQVKKEKTPGEKSKGTRPPREGWDFMPKGFWDGLEYFEEEEQAKKVVKATAGIRPETVYNVSSRVMKNRDFFEAQSEIEAVLR
jgi:hypothetical protein